MKTVYGIDKITEMVLAFNSETRYEKLLNIILTKMMELTCSDAGTLYIVEDGALHFRILKNNTLNIFQNEEDEIDLPPVPLNEETRHVNVCANAAMNNEIVIIDDVYTSNMFNFSGPKNYDKITGYLTRSMLALPLSTCRDGKQEVLGVMQLLNATDPETGKSSKYNDIFNPPVLPALANIAANTLANLVHLGEIRMLFRSFAETMARTIDERSSYSSNHTINMARLCEKFAKYLSTRFPEGNLFFNEKRLEELTMSAILHDIGKIVTPVSIMDKSDRLGEKLTAVRYRFEIKKLQTENDMFKGVITKSEFMSQLKVIEDAKQLVETVVAPSALTEQQIVAVQNLSKLTYRNAEGKSVPLFDPEDIDALSVRYGTLTKDERQIMQEHATVTGRILDSAAFSKYYANVYKWAQSHHELLDGTGYPAGIKGESVPIEVCILTIMDIFEALTANDRPYRKAIPPEEAIETLQEMAKSGKLHSEMVELFRESRVWE
jgi:HD-GYP domain-containing protein (c-di-GMP phosphodiesterase class II)